MTQTFQGARRALLPLAALVQITGLAATPVAVSYPPAEDIHSEVLRRYLNAVELQQIVGRCVDVEVTIQASLPKLNRQAEARVMRSTSCTGRITYQSLEAGGDSMVRREVIARYLAAEGQAAGMDDIAITASHYRFRFVRSVVEPNSDQPDRRIHIFQLTPKQKRVGLFKGELWLDGQTGMPVHVSGRFVRSPSVFLKRIEFARDYQILNGLAIPDRVVITVETRLAGHAELSVQFSHYAYREFL